MFTGFFTVSRSSTTLNNPMVPALVEGSGAISCYPLQSFGPNPGPKGFSLLSGLWYQSSKEV